ncbi:PTS transporter subunit EIIC [Allokutzneria sp. NRRL B-24872]|uniref:PTS transporter subunit EIIC n=1 Tax=Allokutzneria sp. NRRL B-24872 TaxID=1137961 RepID=UPI000A39875F|nr:PTS transporter subunit EIIC [Allokutzneria sp. NRRL B-24872]
MSATPGGRDIKGLAVLQRIGRSLMLPIAALPAAGLLLRLGQDDLLGGIGGFEKVAAVIGGAGGALFDYLPLLFAVGVAIGFAKKADGSTALAAVVGYLVLAKVVLVFNPLAEGKEGTPPNSWPYGVLTGLIAGLLTAWLWQRYHRIKLPPYLAFFGGRRFVPMITAVIMIPLGVALGLLYPLFNSGITTVGEWVTGSTIIGAGAYGAVNRLLLPFGLHHILNSFVWFVFGEYGGQQGDLNRFIKGHDPSAGTFMTGFFPIFMFALPAAALAIWHTAKPSQRKIVGGIMLSAALTAFVTGVTEPLEFSFLFVAWPLYLIHALLTGVCLALVNALDIHTGFTFSAGAIDYVLNWNISTNPVLIIPIGIAFAVVYYFLFRFVITKWNLRTPGREEESADPQAEPSKA